VLKHVEVLKTYVQSIILYCVPLLVNVNDYNNNNNNNNNNKTHGKTKYHIFKVVSLREKGPA
jgi:hypothetical protein